MDAEGKVAKLSSERFPDVDSELSAEALPDLEEVFFPDLDPEFFLELFRDFDPELFLELLPDLDPPPGPHCPLAVDEGAPKASNLTSSICTVSSPPVRHVLKRNLTVSVPLMSSRSA